MPHDPAITPDDIRQDFEMSRHIQGEHVTLSVYTRWRRVDAARRYARRSTALHRLPQRISQNPINNVISKEHTRMVQEALRKATASQQKIAQLLMSGVQRCEIAKRLGVSRSAVTHMLQRLRPLLLKAK